jgi:hypothetical protein
LTLRTVGGKEQRRLMALASKERLVKILEKMLDEDEFLSEHGIRSSVKFYPNISIFSRELQAIETPQRTSVGNGCQWAALRSWILAG